MSDNPTACENTDRELWREREGDYYANSIFVTKHSGIGINCGGSVIVRPIREWHKLASDLQAANVEIENLKLSADLAHAANEGNIKKLEAAEKDAARYRKLRALRAQESGDNPEFQHMTEDELDAAIDAALSEKK